MSMSRRDLFFGVVVTVLWGCNFSVIALGLETLDPYLLTLLRFTFCAFPLVFFVRRPVGISYWVLGAYGVLFGAGLWWMVNFAMYKGLSAGMSAVFLQFSAFFTIGWGALVLKERITLAHACGVLFALGGLSLILLFSDKASTSLGIVIVLLAALAWSLCNLLVKLCKPVQMMAFIIWTSLFAVPAILILTLLTQGFEPFAGLGRGMAWGAVFSIAFQSYITTLLGYLVWNNLMKKYAAAQVAPLSLLVPVSGLLASHVFYGEQLSAIQGAAIGLILVGIAIFLNAGALQGTVAAIRRGGQEGRL